MVRKGDGRWRPYMFGLFRGILRFGYRRQKYRNDRPAGWSDVGGHGSKCRRVCRNRSAHIDTIEKMIGACNANTKPSNAICAPVIINCNRNRALSKNFQPTNSPTAMITNTQPSSLPNIAPRFFRLSMTCRNRAAHIDTIEKMISACAANTKPSKAICALVDRSAPVTINCGRNARKNNSTFGLSTFISTPRR